MSDGTIASLFGAPITFVPSRILDPASYASGGAGMAGTAPDMLRFFEMFRRGSDAILRASTMEQMLSLSVGSAAQTWGPGWGFGLGWAVLEDPALAATPQARGTIQWGGVYGHSWFVDRANSLTLVALTNTAFEGMIGSFSTDIRDAVYRALHGRRSQSS
jgi:CubicO group peptidase (beta-lactamase class C family)